jgi:hypothetical protein
MIDIIIVRVYLVCIYITILHIGVFGATMSSSPQAVLAVEFMLVDILMLAHDHVFLRGTVGQSLFRCALVSHVLLYHICALVSHMCSCITYVLLYHICALVLDMCSCITQRL